MRNLGPRAGGTKVQTLGSQNAKKIGWVTECQKLKGNALTHTHGDHRVPKNAEIGDHRVPKHWGSQGAEKNYFRALDG